MYCVGLFGLPLQKCRKLVDLNNRNYFLPGFWILDPHTGIWPVHVVERAFGLECGLLPSVWGTYSFLCRWMEGGSVGTSFSMFFKRNNNTTEWLAHYYDLRISPLRLLPPRMITSNMAAQSELQRNVYYKFYSSSFKYWGSLAFPMCESWTSGMVFRGSYLRRSTRKRKWVSEK